jgi:hypothetical protein
VSAGVAVLVLGGWIALALAVFGAGEDLTAAAVHFAADVLLAVAIVLTMRRRRSRTPRSYLLVGLLASVALLTATVPGILGGALALGGGVWGYMAWET